VTTVGSEVPIDLERLFKLRLLVARIGEMDIARWWNTNGVLGPLGRQVMTRGFPKSHRFAQARVVFAVAAARCREVFDPPGCMTLWSLPAEIEDQVESSWQSWVDSAAKWEPYFEWLEKLSDHDLLARATEAGLATATELEQARQLRRGAMNRSVPLPGIVTPSNHALTQLALGFWRGEPGELAVPYARLEA